MSYSAICIVPKIGEVYEAMEFRNSHRGSMAIWRCLWEKYRGADFPFSLDDYDALWDLGRCDETARKLGIPESDRVCMTWTFDRVIVTKEDRDWLCGHLDKFVADHHFEEYHPHAWSAFLRTYEFADNDYGFCLIGTSVNADSWKVELEEEQLENEDDETSRMFDLSKDAGKELHWMLGPETFR